MPILPTLLPTHFKPSASASAQKHASSSKSPGSKAIVMSSKIDSQLPFEMFSDKRGGYNQPVARAFTATQFIHGGGVAIFHVKSARVVVVHHTKEDHWFLPKGRKDVGETSIQGAEREGFEESGFRNRVLPLPHATKQTWPESRKADPSPSSHFHTEPLATDLFPMGRHQIQYICSWYVAETLPPDLQDPISVPSTDPSASAADKQVEVTDRQNLYRVPPASPPEQSLEERMALEPEGWEPVRVARSTTQRDEVWYRAELMGIEEAVGKLKGTGLEYIVVEGWRMIQERLRIEREKREDAAKEVEGTA